MKSCPLCGNPMTKEHGTISEPMLRTGAISLVRVSRPGTFWSCSACENCEEVGDDATRATSIYPAGWPRCACGAPVLDGHLTCGQVGCDEVSARVSRGELSRG